MKDPEVVETVLEDGAVLLNLKTNFYYSLNETGRTIWQMIDSTESHANLIQKVMDEYHVEDGHAKESISNFIKELEKDD